MTSASPDVAISSKEPYRLLDLFAGAGGLTRGFVQAGYVPVQAVEFDPIAAATYQANFGPHVFAGPIEDFRVAEHVKPGAVNVIVGGPPCQGFSNLGKRLPDDPRNVMWSHYVDVVAEVRPMAFVLENVDRFLKSDEFISLQQECALGGRLADYRLVHHEVLNTADFGVPQARRRTVVVGLRQDVLAAGASFDLRPTHAKDGLDGSEETPRRWRTVREALSGLDQSDDLTTELPAVGTVEVRLPSGTRVSVPGPYRTAHLHVGRELQDLSKKRFAKIPQGGNWRNLPDNLKAPCWLRRTSVGSGDVMGRLHWDRPSVTIRTEFFKPEKGRYLHPTAHRPITHLEAARLMGFPDSHLWCGSKVRIARQIGNAVPPPLARAVAEALHKVLDAYRRAESSTEILAVSA